MKFKKVWRYDPDRKIFRLCRIIWAKGEVGDGKGFSCKLSLALAKGSRHSVPNVFICSGTTEERFFRFKFPFSEREFCVLGWRLRLHYMKSFGGTYV